jgi:rhamnose transport system substrate-binding protein
MKTRIAPLRMIAVAAAVATMFAATACAEDDGGGDGSGTPGTGSGEIQEGLSIAFLPKQVNNPYFTIAGEGGSEAVAEFGGNYSETGPSEASPSAQVSYINTLSQQDTDVIVVSANDPDAICGALNEARAAEVNVVTFDSDTNPDCRDLFVNQASAEGIARSQLELISEAIGEEGGEIAVLSATANATNQNTWIAEMEELLATPEFEHLELVTTVYGDDDDQKSFQETQGLLASYPDLKGIIAPTTVGIAAAARYLSGSEYKGEVKLTGLGTPNQMRSFVEDGTVEAFALWNPADLGYLAAYAAGALASGIITGAEGETFQAGRLGEYAIDAGGVVLLGDPFVFDASNIDDFDF